MHRQTLFLIFVIYLTTGLSLSSCKDDVSVLYNEDSESASGQPATDSDTIINARDSATADTVDTNTTSQEDSGTIADSATGTTEETTTDDSGTVADTGTETAADTGTETAADTETVPSGDTATTEDTGTESDVPVEGLLIQAECAIQHDLAVCDATTPNGSCSALEDTHSWINDPNRNPQTYPTFTSDQQVGYTAGGSWFAFDGIDLSQYSKLTMKFASQEDANNTITTGFHVRIDTSDGAEIAFLETYYTGSWQTYDEVEVSLSENVSGTHTIFFVAETFKDANDTVIWVNNGNVDWINFHN